MRHPGLARGGPGPGEAVATVPAQGLGSRRFGVASVGSGARRTGSTPALLALPRLRAYFTRARISPFWLRLGLVRVLAVLPYVCGPHQPSASPKRRSPSPGLRGFRFAQQLLPFWQWRRTRHELCLLRLCSRHGLAPGGNFAELVALKSSCPGDFLFICGSYSFLLK